MDISIFTPTLFVLLVVLWTLDLVETTTLTKRNGSKVEENPLIRFLLKKSRIDFFLFKTVDLIFLSFIIYFIYSSNTFLASVLLMIFVLIYLLTVLHNYIVIKRSNVR